LIDIAGVLGPRAMQALTEVAAVLDLQYAESDFALSPDGSVLLFEANATIGGVPTGTEPVWDYRRAAIDAALQAQSDALTRLVRRAPNRRATCTPPRRP